MAKVELTLQIRMPWWLPLYVWTLRFFHEFHLVEVDPGIVGKFVASWTRVRAHPGGKWEYLKP